MTIYSLGNCGVVHLNIELLLGVHAYKENTYVCIYLVCVCVCVCVCVRVCVSSDLYLDTIGPD